MEFLKEFLSDPDTFYEEHDVKDLIKLAKKADKEYFNLSTPIMNDKTYDILKEMIMNKDPDNKYLQNVGAKVVGKSTIKLPFIAGSMSKPTSKTIDKFIVQFKKSYPGPYICSQKIDGMSAIHLCQENQLSTKGDGRTGTDISKLMEHLLDVEVDDLEYVRGEIVMNDDVFQNKYSEEFSNGRNLINSFANSKKSLNLNAVKDSNYIAYEIIKPWMPFDKQFKTLKKHGYKVVKYEILDDFDKDMLLELYRKYTSEADYECDGIIISQNAPKERDNSEFPKYSFAFKSLDDLETKDVAITKIKWQVSKDGYCKPVIIYDPIEIGGVINQRATAFNAKFIFDNKLGPGSIIRIVRSGNVIPYIKEVIKGSRKAEMPSFKYEWNLSGVDIIASEYSEEQKINELYRFCSDAKIEGLAKGKLKKLIDAKIDSIEKILTVTENDLKKVEGFKMKSVQNLLLAINTAIGNLTLTTIMVASNIFGHGFGPKLIGTIIKNYPDIIFRYIESTDEQLYELISNLDGFAEERTLGFINGMPSFLTFLSHIPDAIQDKLLYNIEEEVKESNKFKDKSFVFSGIRDKEIKEYIEANGGSVKSKTSSKTYMVITTEESRNLGTNDNIKTAIENECLIYTVEEFRKKYM